MGSCNQAHEADGYWRRALAGYQGQPFPSCQLNSSPDKLLQRSFNWPRCSSITAEMTLTIARATWALVVSRLTNSEDVVFGVADAPRRGVCKGAVPFRVRMASNQTISQFLDTIHCQSTEILPFAETELRRIAGLDPSCERACAFQSTLNLWSRRSPRDWRSRQMCAELEGSKDMKEMQEPIALAVELQQHVGEMIATASFDSRIIKAQEVYRLLELLEMGMKQLDGQHPDKSLRKVELMTTRDLDQIWEWNATVPESIKRCVHELIEERVKSQPNAPAICAWDGSLTYQQLDMLSTGLAMKLTARLNDLGIRENVVVPLCFEKSMWTSVSILAVMKAGGAFVLLDPLLPEQRLRNIVGQVEASLILSSSQQQSLSLRLIDQVLVVSAESFESSDSFESSESWDASVAPSSPIYVVFTSGSTGDPKGAVITHGNIASAIHHQASLFHLTPESRVFDFASYSFDVSISSALTTLATGGCLCVPSDDDRTNDLTGSIISSRANVLDLTPSVAQFLVPESLQNVHTIILSGEMVSVKDISPWWEKVERVLNVYGPAECTATSTINALAASPKEAAGCIGKGAGVVTWIVDPEDHEHLLPLGCIGELLLEGPLLSCEYIRNPEKSSQAFIHDPSWLLRGAMKRSGRHGRLYKTGDLAKYEPNGSLRFIGRKDTQVKIHGQRVELGEVEHHVRQCVLNARHVIAEIITPGGKGSNPVLAAFIQMDEEPPSMTAVTAESINILTIAGEVMDRLAERLPAYMVPSVYFSVQQLPTTPTGKTDRRRLKQIGSSFTTVQLAEARLVGQQRVMARPMSRVEQQIQRIWGQVLNLEPASIGLEDSFFQLGGDSITALQVSAAARALSLNIRTVDLLQKKTIANLAKDVKALQRPASTMAKDQLWTKMSGRAAPEEHGTALSPVQNLYCQLQSSPNQCYDLNFLLRIRQDIATDALTSAMRVVVGRHAMLRARFRKSGTSWEQRITDDVARSFSVRTENMRDGEAATVAQLIAGCRESLDIENGPLFSALLLDASDSQMLFLTVHHLVIDLVSWRIVLRELEDVLISGAAIAARLQTPFLEFSSWIAAQARYAAEHLCPDTSTPFEFQPCLPAYWEMEGNDNLQGKGTMQEFTIDQSASSIILGDGNNALGTRPVELLIAALIRSFNLVFSDRPTPPIFCEGHGREVWDDSMDVSTTVGWFTTMYPVQTRTNSRTSLLDTISQTKDCFRSVSQNGWSYFTSRFSDEAKARKFASQFPVEILFNYEGAYQQLERPEGLFETLSLPCGCDPQGSEGVRRFSFFEVWAKVDRGCIAVTMTYHRDMLHQYRILHWVETYRKTLVEMAQQLPSCMPSRTLSDLPSVLPLYKRDCIVQGGQMRREAEDSEKALPGSLAQECTIMCPIESSKVIPQAKASSVEPTLRSIWSRVLNIASETIGPEGDDFFRLGGHLIAAEEVVSEARSLGIDLIVDDVFRHPCLSDLAHHVCASQRRRDAGLTHSIEPLNINLRSCDVEDILPTTFFQEYFLADDLKDPRQYYNFYYIDLPRDLDVARFHQSCRQAADRFPILRTCFRHFQGRFWQVVLRQVDDLFHVHQVHGALDSFLDEFCGNQMMRPSLDSPATAIALLQGREKIRFVLRLHHAQFDGLSLVAIVQFLFDSCHGKHSPTTPSLSDYLRYTRAQRSRSITYWKKLLRGSSPTRILHKLSPIIPPTASHDITVTRTLTCFSLPAGVTAMSLVNAAWAILLWRISGDTDIVYSSLVAGRNADLEGVQTMAGPCVNMVPVRISLSTLRTPEDVLRSIQEQLFAMGEADSLHREDLVRHCTDWPATTTLESNFQHLGYDLDVNAGGWTKVHEFANPHQPDAPHFFMQTQTYSAPLRVDLWTNTALVTQEAADNAVDMFCATISSLVACLGRGLSLQSWMSGLEPWETLK